MIEKKNFYINGKWVSPSKPNNFKVIDPSTEEPFAIISLGSEQDADDAIKAAKTAFESWRETSKEDRLSFLDKDEDSLKIDDLGLIPNIRWDKKIAQHWNMGEVAAHINLSQFLKTGIKNYKEGRNYPSKPNVSKLSPHMHFGEISPNQIWYKLKQEEPDKNIDHFMSDLGWREFSYNLLYFNPDLRT